MQIKEVANQAKRMGCLPHEVRNSDGNWALTPLLQAKAMAYNTIVMLQQGKK